MSSTRDVLTRDLAQSRAKAISEVKYSIGLYLNKASKTYEGDVVIDFSLKKSVLHSENNLVIDFIGEIKNFKVNNKEVKYEKSGSKIKVNKKDLNEGSNSIEASYKNIYDKTGDGLHHFKDSEDGMEYLYTHLEPYSAHRVFPCFDQPDLKAIFSFKVSAPKEWTIISNTKEKSVKSSTKNKEIIFEPTPRISTYLFHLSAGEYISFEDTYKHNGQETPLRIFCRKSLKKYLLKYVKTERMFKFTKQGLAFYSDLFDFAYPFGKYDQIFTPEFNMGAMENVGAVTFTERLLFQHEPTRNEISRLADILLHEMVHMWFGNLVTMKWWDDLWLNESFADYLSYYGMTKATEFKDGWQSFYSRKAWAYVEDQMLTTHPIAADAPDTDVAFINFDGISYAKGAGVLKQLMYSIGEENFIKGVRHYFKKHQWGNTELKDFIQSMENASGKSLKAWTDSWILTTGVNLIRPEWSVKNGKITELSLIQEQNKSPLKSHETKIALLYEKNGKCEVEKEIGVKYNAVKTKIKDAEGLAEPNIIFTNYYDYDYIQAFLDDKSLKYACQNIQKVSDNLTRQMILGSIWQMVRNAEVDPNEYIKLVAQNAIHENDLTILESHVGRVAKTVGDYSSDEQYRKYSQQFYNLGWEGLKKAPKGSKNVWFSLITTTAGGAESIDDLIYLLNGKIEIKDFEFNQEKRWVVLILLAARGHKDAEKLLNAEEKKDKSDKGKKFMFEAKVSMLDTKKKHWDMFVKGEKYSLDHLREGMSGFYWKRQKKELIGYREIFFKEIKDIFKKKDRHYSLTFCSRLYPGMFIDRKTLEMTQKLLGEKNLPQILRKELLQEADEMSRSLRILEKYSS